MENKETNEKTNEKEGEQLALLNEVIRGFAERDCFPSTVLRKIRNKENQTFGYEFDLVNPWYTAQPISTINDLQITVCENAIDADNIYIIIRDQKIPVKQAKTVHELWWGYGEVGKVFFEGVDEKSISLQSELEIKMQMRTTIVYGFPNNMVSVALKRKMEVK